MLTVFREGRGFRVVWLLEEMGLPYRLRGVDLLAGAETDAAFMAINPAGFIPALRDGEAVMVESIAITEYLLARYGLTALAPGAGDPAFPTYLQFLHLRRRGSPPRTRVTAGAGGLSRHATLVGKLGRVLMKMLADKIMGPRAEWGGGAHSAKLSGFSRRADGKPLVLIHPNDQQPKR